MNYCHVSAQIDAYTRQLGNDAAEQELHDMQYEDRKKENVENYCNGICKYGINEESLLEEFCVSKEFEELFDSARYANCDAVEFLEAFRKLMKETAQQNYVEES